MKLNHLFYFDFRYCLWKNLNVILQLPKYQENIVDIILPRLLIASVLKT